MRDCAPEPKRRGTSVSEETGSQAEHGQVPQNGVDQFVSEGDMIEKPSGSDQGTMHPADEFTNVRQSDAGQVNAVQVSMERSGADSIHAQNVTLDRSGAKSLTSKSADLSNSGALVLKADRADLNQSSVVIAQAKDLHLTESALVVGMAESVHIDGAGKVGLVQAGKVEAAGDVNATFVMAGSVHAGGDVNVTFNAVSAGILGAAFAGVLFGLRRLFDR
jgi:hypothetical protein